MRDRIELYDAIQEMLLCEVDKIVKNNNITPSQVDVLDKLVDIVKDLDEMIFNEEDRMNEAKEGYSQRSMPRYNYYKGNSYRDSGYSRKSEPMHDGMMKGGYSRGNSKDGMIEYLYLAMNNASSDEEHKRIKRMIDEIENAK